MVVAMSMPVTPNMHKLLPDFSREDSVEQRTDTLSSSISQVSGATSYYTALDDVRADSSSSRTCSRPLARSISGAIQTRSSQDSASTSSVVSRSSSWNQIGITLVWVVVWPAMFLFFLYQLFSDAVENIRGFFRNHTQNY